MAASNPKGGNVTRLRHLALRVRDLPRSRRFYEEGLGLTFLGYRPSGESVDLSDGEVNLTLLPYAGPQRHALVEGAEFIHLGLLVDDANASYERLSKLDAVVVRDDVKERLPHDPASRPIGSFKVLDPDGNVLDISDRPNEWRIGSGRPA
jgi:catechol 2,3-dioxygenase-like lactoylglutathione lyase family enzyme